MSGWTNRGKLAVMTAFFRGGQTRNIALLTATTAPGADTNLMSDVEEVSTGNGYTSGGIAVTMNATDVDVITEDDVNDRCLIQFKDIIWTASGGTLPSSDSARYAVLTDNDGTVADREIHHYWDLGSNKQVSSGNTLTLADLEIRIDETA